MQKVEMYYDIVTAETEMERYIRGGWRIHACAMGALTATRNDINTLLVVYEKE